MSNASISQKNPLPISVVGVVVGEVVVLSTVAVVVVVVVGVGEGRWRGGNVPWDYHVIAVGLFSGRDAGLLLLLRAEMVNHVKNG